MRQNSASDVPSTAGKARNELETELTNSYRTIAKLKRIIAGQQKVIEVRKALPDKRDELEVRLECDATLREELEESRQGVEELNAELEAQMEELEAQNDELLHTQRALQNSEEMLRLAVDGARIGLWDWDVGTGRLAWSDRCREIFGLHPGPALDYDAFLATVHPDDRKQVDRAFKEALNDRIDCDVEMRIRRKDGPEHWVIAKGHGVYDDADKAVRMVGIILDITGRKLAEEALRESEARFRAYLDNSAVIAWMKDGEGRHVFLSQNYEKRFGVSIADWRGKTDFEIWPREIAEKFRENDLAVLRGGKPIEVIEEVRNPDGSSSWWLNNKFPFVDASGKKYVGGLGVDITERKRAEEALDLARGRLAADLAAMSRLQEVSMHLIAQDDLGSLLGEIVEAAIEVTGADMGNVQIYDGEGEPKIGESRGFQKPFLDFFNRVRTGKAACGMAMAKGERVIAEDVAESPIFKDTPEMDVLLAAGVRAVQSTPLVSRSGRLLGMFSTHYRAPHRPDEREILLLDMLARQAADLIERMQIEDAFRESEERFRVFMDHSPAVAWIKDTHGQYVYINKAYVDEFGVKPEDRLGKTDFELWPREIAGELRKSSVDVMVSGRPAHVIEEVPNADGSKSYWFDVKFPFKDAAGNMFVGGIGVNITRQKQAEAALQEAKGRNELYVDLMGHDINNINQVAIGYLELAAESLNLEGEDKELIQKPLEALNTIVMLIQNVQKLKKLEGGGLRAEAIDLDTVLGEMKKRYSHGTDKKVVINYKPHPGHRVLANGLLADVFANLIGNAIKHTLRDHVTINIRLNTVHQDGKKYYKVVVEDNGPGIPDNVKQRLFNRFERGNTRAHGKGLGLYLVKMLVDDFHGMVRVEDRVKDDHAQGSRFVVMLPAFEDGVATARESPRIGIVEDDRRVADLYKKVLAKHGYRVDHTAVNGIEAVDMVKNSNPGPDVIIMDHRMPGMTGLAATREILKIAPRVKVIFASADAGVGEEALKAGAVKFLYKPVAPKDIVRAINDVGKS